MKSWYWFIEILIILVVVSNIFYIHPHLGKIPILTNIFKWVETTNQSWFVIVPIWLGSFSSPYIQQIFRVNWSAQVKILSSTVPVVPAMHKLLRPDLKNSGRKRNVDALICVVYIPIINPEIPTTMETMGVNITTIAYLRVLIIEIGSTIILMVVEAQGKDSC